MQAHFTRADDNQLGIRFAPETFEEQLLLEQFTRHAIQIGHRFEFSGFEHNASGRNLREGLTSVWGKLFEGPMMPDARTTRRHRT